jgi:uncharacterized Zn finger protein
MSSSLSISWPQLNDDTLLALAGEGAFARGSKYAQQGCAVVAACTGEEITGRVHGSANYRVALYLVGEELQGDCNCPMGDQGDFCKHQVALALAARGDLAPSSDDGLAAFLRAQPAESLADKLLAFAAQFREVEKDLAFWHKSSRAHTGAELNKVIGTLLRGGGFLDYRKSFDYAHRVAQVADLLRGLVKIQPALCVESAEYALLRLFKTLEQSDDSAGVISGAMSDLVMLHRAALPATQPGKKYGQRFFKLVMADGWDFIQPGSYRPLFGEEAWAEYGRCLEGAYAKLPPRVSSQRSYVFTAEDTERSQLARLLKDWYALNDDRDALLTLKARELREPWDYADLVQQYREFGRHREALEWAEKALRQFPDDSRLYRLLAECYRHDGCDEEAENLLWQWFEKFPAAENFFELMKQAGKQGAAWRKRAFAYLEQCEARNLKRLQARDHNALPDVSTRLAILLHEKNIDEAVATSRNAEASAYLTLELADQARPLYPEVSIPIFRGRIERLVNIGGNGNYEEALGYLNKLLPLLDAADRDNYLNELRVRFKAKRNFIKLLETL